MTSASSRTSPIIRRTAGPLRLILAPGSKSGLIAAQILIRRGSADESQNEIGVASFTASMLKRGTKTRTSAQTAFELESLGAMTSFGAGADASVASIQSAAEDFSPAFEIFADCLKHPAFDLREMEVERQSVLAAIRRIEDEKFDYTYREYIKRIFEGHGYAHPVEGEAENVQAITAAGCAAWHTKTFHPQNMLAVIAGDFDPDRMAELFARHFGDWNPSGDAGKRYDCATTTQHRDKKTVIEKELEQGFIVMGFPTPNLTHPDHPALRLGAAALGEGFAGRLFRHLRDERSLAYAVGAMLRSLRLGGHMALYIGTQPERLEDAQEGLLSETEALRRTPLNVDDLTRARQYVIGKYLMGHQSLASRAGYLAQWEDAGVGAEYDREYVNHLKKVTADEIIEAARRWWVNPTIVQLKPKAEAVVK
ncbi:insulinase family protein [Candidatus Sumerlaeota bacterium]|nr:insulinase family protein [Candidatus Sumerlaeota bacterium]